MSPDKSRIYISKSIQDSVDLMSLEDLDSDALDHEITFDIDGDVVTVKKLAFDDTRSGTITFPVSASGVVSLANFRTSQGILRVGDFECTLFLLPRRSLELVEEHMYLCITSFEVL